MNPKKGSYAYLAVIFMLAGLSIGAVYYRYVVRQDFVYFPIEEQIPDQFNPTSYPQL